MIRLLRIAIQCLLVLLLVSIAVAIGATETGAAEKVVLGVLAGLLVFVAVLVRRLGVRPQPR
jgi:hypoxanthine-guanine phosphoribosyltransferase